MKGPRIALIHATRVAMEPIQREFASAWPEARITNLLEDSLSQDLADAGSLDDRLVDRFVTLTRYAHFCGADAVLFTCSAFGPAIEVARASVAIPVLKPNEAMIDEALAHATDIALLATFEPAIAPMRKEIEEAAAARGATLVLETRAIPRALTALQAGHADLHDALIAQEAQTLAQSKVIVLAQFSMASAASGVRKATGRTVLTSPESAVSLLKRKLA